jgi:probable phosphoglycerate mutase
MAADSRPDPRPDTRLVLIRHGESVAQVEGFLSGHDTCRGLSDLGRAQAEALRDRLLTTHELDPVDAVFTSILPRAIETAQIIAPALGEAMPQRECDWCEIHAGEAEGLTWDELRERYPSFGDPHDLFKRRTPNGESWAEFAVRAGARLRRIAEEHEGERVVVVCHGGIIGASFVALGEVSIHNVRNLAYELVNTSLTEWRWTGSSWHLIRFNDAAHIPR